MAISNFPQWAKLRYAAGVRGGEPQGLALGAAWKASGLPQASLARRRGVSAMMHPNGTIYESPMIG